MMNKLRLLAPIFAITALLFATSSLGQQGIEGELDTWVEVNPYVSKVVSARDCEVEPGPWYMPGVVVDPVKLKVGHAYAMADYNWPAKAKWTWDLITKPERAVAKRTFEVYNLEDFKPEDWQALRDAYSKDPALTAFLVPGDDGFIATPVKWNRAYAEVMEDALVAADEAGDEQNQIVYVMAGEIIDLANQEASGKSVGPWATSFVPVHEKEALWDAAMAYDCGQIDAFSLFSPGAPIYIAFSETPKNFRVPKKDSLITTSGAQGQPLGKMMPAWPNKESEKAPESPNGAGSVGGDQK